MPKTHAPNRKGASRTLQAQIEHRSVADLKANPRNARTHSPKQISQIAASIAEFGFTNPVLIDGHDTVVAGHGRLEAAKKVGLSTVPTVRLGHLSPEQLRAYVIADNQLALRAGWDVEILGLELAELSALDLGFDVTITGFDWPEIDMAIGTPAAAVKDDPLDRVPEIACTAVTRESDLWLIGPHRLICGDATKPETFAALLGDERAQLVFCDPPYNVPIDGHVSAGSGTTLVAAHKTRRKGFGIELDPIYCDVILKRLAAVTGQEPRHAQTGLPFHELQQRRLAELDPVSALDCAHDR